MKQKHKWFVAGYIAGGITFTWLMHTLGGIVPKGRRQ